MENGELQLHKYDWSDLNVSNVNTFPSAKDLACLSYAVYYQIYGTNVTYNIESRKDQPTIKPLPDSWKLIATARCKVFSVWPPSIGDGYHGAAYYNVSSKHLVIAHRGTDLTNVGSIWADIAGVTLSRCTSQVNSAYQFTKQIVDRFWESAISISVTGHSLGGWLSQTSAFFIKYPDLAVDFLEVGSNFTVDVVDLQEFNSSDHLPSHHLHVVAFDSPGALNAMEEYFFKHYPRYSDNRFVRMKYLNDLDVTTYFSYPNVVNSVKMHIGSLFMMPDINTHKMKNILQFWQSDESANKKLLKVIDWRKGLTEQNLHHTKVQSDNELANSKYLAQPIHPNSVRMSTFELEEWNFLDNIRFLKEQGVLGEKISWETLFKDKSIASANAIFSGGEFADYTKAKNIFEFFDSFDIVDSQVLEVDNRFKIEFFIRLVKYFVKNLDLPAVVKEVISEFPKVYEAIYRALKTEYLNSIIEVNAIDFPLLKEFLESSQLRVYQAVADQSTLVCVAKIVSSLKSERFSFGGDLDVRLDMKNTMFLSSELLAVLDRHVSIAKIVPPNDDFKLIVIENRDKEIQPTLKFLIDKVLEESTHFVKLILVTRQTIDFQDCSQMEISPFYLKKEMEMSDQSILFEHLTIDQQTKVLNSEICFQGEDMQLKNLVSLEDLYLTSNALDQVTLCQLLSPTSKISLGGCSTTLKEFERSYYVPRHFHQINQYFHLQTGGQKVHKFTLTIDVHDQIVRIKILNYIEEDNFETYEIENSFEVVYTAGFIGLKKGVLVEFTPERAHDNLFQSHFEVVRPTMTRFFYDINNLHWDFTTMGTELKISYEGQCNEQELLELQQHLVIISDDPGMGKSTILKKLAEQCKGIGLGAGRASWVISINLGSHVELLKKWKKSEDLESATNFLFQIDGSASSNSDVGKCFLKYFLQQEGRVQIFFDGLDEIENEVQSKVEDIVMTLLKQTKAKIFLTSRSHLRSSLQEKFQCDWIMFLPLDDQEKVEFLTKFWIEHPALQKFKENSIAINVVPPYARHLIEKLKQSLNIEQIDSFIEVPLQLFMLGTVSIPSVCSYLTEVQSNEGQITDCMLEQNLVLFDNIFHLYQIFIAEKFHISLKEKLKLKQMAENHPWHYEQLVASLIELHRIASFSFIFPNECQELLCSNSVLSIEENQVLFNVGIIQSDSIDSTSLQFIHRSLAEYFAADFLVNRLKMPHMKEKVINFLRKNYFHPQFEKIRFFVDYFISIQPECHPIFQKCLNFEKEKLAIFAELEREENCEIYDLLGRNVLHYAICYGDQKEGILWCLIQNQHLFDKPDVFGCDFFSYLVLLTNVQFSAPKFDSLFNAFPYLFFILCISGRMQRSIYLLMRESHDISYITEAIVGDEKDLFFSEKQISKFMKIIRSIRSCSDIELKELDDEIPDKREILDIDRKVRIFSYVVLEHWKRPELYSNAFEMAMTTNSEAHLDIATFMLKISEPNIMKEMLSLMARNGCALLKNYVEHDTVFYFECRLWKYCKEHGKEEEMFDFYKATNFLTFNRFCSSSKNSKFEEHQLMREHYFEVYEKIGDENLRNEMVFIVQNSFDKIFEEDCQSETIERNCLDVLECVNCFIWMRKFLPLEYKTHVLEERFVHFSCCIETLIQYRNSDKACEFVKMLCTSVSPEVARKYKQILLGEMISNYFSLNNTGEEN